MPSSKATDTACWGSLRSFSSASTCRSGSGGDATARAEATPCAASSSATVRRPRTDERREPGLMGQLLGVSSWVPTFEDASDDVGSYQAEIRDVLRFSDVVRQP